VPELPEVETVRRMLESSVVGRTVRSARLSGKKLREPVPRATPRLIMGRTVRGAGRRGKFLLVELEGGITLLSHLGMSGRWLFFEKPPRTRLPHVHARIAFEDGSVLWYQDARRFGLLRAVRSERLDADPALARLGNDPIASPPSGPDLGSLARGLGISVKGFLLDQKRIAGIGNIYASEILHRAGVDPRRPAGSLGAAEWDSVATQTRAVLGEAIERMGTTFRTYRTLWNEPGAYGERLLVYDRATEPCRRCGAPIRRIVQGQRSTFFCPRCQPRRGPPRAAAPRR
jgi:formamidopyrimidine-DNA glycosylase